MRKLFITILLITILSYAAISTAEEYSTQEELKKIEDETQKCIDANYMTDYAMMQCTIKGTKKYNNEIEKTVKAAKNYLSQSQYEQFLKTHAKWQEFMNENNTLLIQTYEKKCPPYLACLCAASDKYEYTKSRAEDLSGFLGGLLLFKEEGVLDDNLNFVPFNY